ncbi:MAG: tRNA uridine-5-carboxymethylaminomethyl(34) synthesis GTPase MnmE [Desulfomonile tiedjei]|nr:tRNA uridine-5-carboxymethylaminomethyl(34) synthesis GTPase MnmE [Desulfomonile tiedjei]
MKPAPDTIVALATPRDYSGIGVIRLSGPDAVSLLKAIFHPVRAGADFADRTAVYGRVVDPENGKILDDGIAVVMCGPRSYTGEDVVELSLHGSPTILDMVLRLLVSRGARPATRGEFTRRAFLSGRLDLIQAEAVADLIEALTPVAVDEARGRLDRSLSSSILEVSNSLKTILAGVEAYIDFDEDELEPPPESVTLVGTALEAMEALIRAADTGRIRREGVKATIIGKPNVGKSTLFNALVQTDRAIVTPYPGTTRDSLDALVVLDGLAFALCDTAGIREHPEPVEAEGIRRTLLKVAESDIVIAVFDGSAPLDLEDSRVLEACASKPAVVVLNKSDIGTRLDRQSDALGPQGRPRVSLSAKDGEGLDLLREVLAEFGRQSGEIPAYGTSAALTRRGVLLMEAATVPLQRILEVAAGGRTVEPELLSLELRRALEPLEEITGERVDEGVLDRIFERFCVGK